MSKVKDVGIPLDRQNGVKWTGTYPSLGPGEDLKNKLNSFVIGHGIPVPMGLGVRAHRPRLRPALAGRLRAQRLDPGL
jgi:hypothetical protein